MLRTGRHAALHRILLAMLTFSSFVNARGEGRRFYQLHDAISSCGNVAMAAVDSRVVDVCAECAADLSRLFVTHALHPDSSRWEWCDEFALELVHVLR